MQWNKKFLTQDNLLLHKVSKEITYMLQKKGIENDIKKIYKINNEN